jgi:hypothetical protein
MSFVPNVLVLSVIVISLVRRRDAGSCVAGALTDVRGGELPMLLARRDLLHQLVELRGIGARVENDQVVEGCRTALLERRSRLSTWRASMHGVRRFDQVHLRP